MRKRLAVVGGFAIMVLLIHSLLSSTLSFALVGEPTISGGSPTGASLLAQLISWGDKIAAWALALLSSVLTGYIIRRYLSGIAADILARAVSEIVDAVAEVKQTFVSALKEGAADGKLTPEDMRQARERAVTIAKSNIGTKGIARLGRILGVDSLEQWITTKVEAVVAGTKSPGVKVPAPLPPP